MSNEIYDTIIIGCGPAGMSAAIYLGRAFKKVLVIEKETIGGQMASAPFIENYPGYERISGSELSNNMFEQMTKLNVDVELEKVISLKNDEVTNIKIVTTEENIYRTRSIILATGSRYRLLRLPNEEDLIGRGIHFCVSCDGAFYKDKVVAVVGGGNSAVINAITLSDIAKKVYLIHHSKSFKAEEILIQKMQKKKNVEVYLDTEVVKLNGEEELDSIVIKKENKEVEVNVNGLFVAIGLTPQNEFLKDIMPLDEKGYLCTEDTVTAIPGIFVAGDCRKKLARQVVIAASDGAIAAIQAIQYLNG